VSNDEVRLNLSKALHSDLLVSSSCFC